MVPLSALAYAHLSYPDPNITYNDQESDAIDSSVQRAENPSHLPSCAGVKRNQMKDTNIVVNFHSVAFHLPVILRSSLYSTINLHAIRTTR